MSFKTDRIKESILDEAVRFFVADVGLKIVEQAPCCVTFDGEKVGYVTITLSQEDHKFDVTLETREYEYWVRKFAEEFK
jgi:hypothetical protein